MSIIDSLDSIAERLVRRENKEFIASLARYGELLKDALLADETTAVLEPGRDEIDDCLGELHETADLLNAAGHFTDLMRDKSNAGFSDLPIRSRDLEHMRERINMHVEATHSDRGFVYIAHRAASRKVFYVGQGTSRKRVDLPSHAKLTHALSRSNGANTLTFLFPMRSTPQNLNDLEAAVIRLVKYEYGDDEPILNKMPVYTNAHPLGTLRLEAATRRCKKILSGLYPPGSC